jgi:hypothetical protein
MFWTAVAAYLAAGVVFALAFVFGGARRLDRATGGASVAFRLFIIPGAAALWPLLLLMWIAGAGANKRNAR